ncbi:MAG TPA: proton-conducting transporter membrane subunit [Candidatus Sulfotelmatobacter sp.]|nr:proton-conducting transporter membrane subunit [Candidatus Sulfotelmatobacter sp.]
MVLAPLAAFVLAISSVRTRRSSSSTAMLGAVVTLLATLLVGWGLAKKTTPFLATYQYINLPVAFSGPVNFQGFGIDIVLRVDHLTVAALVAIEICVIGAIGWHQVMGRSEPGAARFHALISGLLFASVGVLVSWDLAELVAFWGMAAAMTYLMQAHRWGLDEAARRSRVALALPFVTDLCLLCGVAWLYARYGVQNLTTLIPILHTNPGWTTRSLVVASVLLGLGLAGRLAIWPLQSWLTQTSVTSPPAASAIAQAVWSVLAIVVLFRVLPIFAATNQQTMQWVMYACAASAVIASLLALTGNEPRRLVALLGSAVSAVGAAIVIHGAQVPHSAFAIAGVACVLAAAPARSAATLAVSAIAGAMRTDDMSEMGDAWRRMRASSLTLLAGAVVLSLSALGGLAFGVSSRSWLGALAGEAVLLVAVGSLRLFLGTSTGPLRRRRAFEPDRVREAPSESLGWPYMLALAGAGFLVASTIRGWLDFLDGLTHPEPSGAAFALWAAVAILGLAAATFAYVRDKDGAVLASSATGGWLDARLANVTAFLERFLVAPSVDIARRVDLWLPSGDGAVARFATASGRLASAGGRLPALPLLVLLAAVLALVVGLAAPGLVR